MFFRPILGGRTRFSHSLLRMGPCGTGLALIVAALLHAKIESAASQSGVVYLDYPSLNSSVQFLQRSSPVNLTTGTVNVSMDTDVTFVAFIHVKIIDVNPDDGKYLSIYVKEVVPLLLFQVGRLEWRIKFRFTVTVWDIVNVIQSITYSDTNLCPQVGLKTIQLRLQNAWGAPLSANSFVLIWTVLRGNRAPTFHPNFDPFQTSVSESSRSAGVIITKVVASDPDAASVPEGQLSYSIYDVTTTPVSADVGTSDLFRIGKDSGELQTQVSLDHESVQSYIVDILVSDSACPSLNDTGRVTIIVKDENDNVPMLLAPDRQLATSKYPVEMDVAQTIQVLDDDTSFYKMKAATVVLRSESEVVYVHSLRGL